MSVAAELAASSILSQNESFNNLQANKDTQDMADNIAGAAGKGYQDAYDAAY
jgi:hypothetical protein